MALGLSIGMGTSVSWQRGAVNGNFEIRGGYASRCARPFTSSSDSRPVIDAKLQADYWRTRVSFPEEVQKQGIDPWAISRAAQRPDLDSTPRSTGPRLAAST
ncbi:hypothetical protein CFB44_26025 [Burkholderia sp. AU31280]|nr:hypothetical protein CFB44_26025 [Burkholderia sp. AU31280]